MLDSKVNKIFSKTKNLVLNLIGRRTLYRLGRTMYFHARGEISNHMTENGEILIQSGVVAAWKRAPRMDANLVIFDVGANLGDWSAMLLEQLNIHAITERVDLFSFEPVPATVEILKRNLPRNNTCLHIEEIALSSSSGSAEIYVTHADAGTNSLYNDSLSGQKETVIIKLISAADFCKARDIQHVHLLKCDTEGHDMEVIRGAVSLLEAERISVLQFEYNYRWVFSRNFLRDAFETIKFLPYKLVKLQADYLLVFEKWHPELDHFFEGNYALVHLDALNWFPSKSASFDQYNALTVA
jgi:FkbM family methyltransferase